MMPYFAAVFGFSSTLSLTILTLSPSCPAISSRAGAIWRQGPHHSAQKSTSTGSEDFRTSASKLASVTCFMRLSLSWVRRLPGSYGQGEWENPAESRNLYRCRQGLAGQAFEIPGALES